jgi:FAD/FMN-containing dehydrogenase
LGRTPPIAPAHGIYVLVETMGADQDADTNRFEAVISAALDSGGIVDAVIAQSGKDAQGLWAIRECTGEFAKIFAPQANFDVSAPTGEIGRLKEALEISLRARWPGIDLVFFGHVADANLHFAARLDDLRAQEHDIEAAAYEIVGQFCGSISAEHGIGSIKREFLHHSRSQAEIAVMRLLKSALDPRGILNPGKVV